MISKRPNGVLILSVKLQETQTIILYHQDNESVDTREKEHLNDVTAWQMYSEGIGVKPWYELTAPADLLFSGQFKHQPHITSLTVRKKKRGTVRIREVSSQTTPRFSVDKATQKAPIEYKTSGAWVTLADMHDEFQKLDKAQVPRIVKRNTVYNLRPRGKKVEKYYGDVHDNKVTETKYLKGVNAFQLLTALGWVERMLSSSEHLHLINLFACGRDLLKSGRKRSMSSKKSKIEPLWTFSSDKCKKFRVNCISFFSNTPWLLVAGCGDLQFGRRGLLIGWNVKKVVEPEIRIELPHPATAVSSCPESPQYCAVAMLDGSLRVYQLDVIPHMLILDTCGSPDKHFAPVWWLEWRDCQVVNSISKGDTSGPSFKRLVSSLKSTITSKLDLAQVLVSASEDGTVKEWVFTKDEGLLACCTLLRIYLPSWLTHEISKDRKLKKQKISLVKNGRSSSSDTKPQNPHCSKPDPSLGVLLEKPLTKNVVEEKSCDSKVQRDNLKVKDAPDNFEGILTSQLVPATCISFRPGSKTDYVLGTVAGDILLCRTFERDRVRQVFRGHTGQVSHVSWRPTGEEPTNIFLSGALDETIRVWNLNKPDAPMCVLKIPKALGGGYLDTKWCPWYGNLLAGVHDGGLHLWDISVSSHAPVLSQAIGNATCVSFSPHTRNVIVGDSHGTIHVIHLEGLEESASLFFKYATGLSKLAKLSISEN